MNLPSLLAASLLPLTPQAQGSSIRFVANEPRKYEFADQASLPPTFGVGEFTFELWVKPDNSYPVGETDRGSIAQLTHWSEADVPPYSGHGWWFEGNWLLDGHSRPNGFNYSDSRAGTFSLQFYGGGRLRWTFADDDLLVPIGKVWAVQVPASRTPSLLDGKWHHVACVRRWVEQTRAQLELWVDGKMLGRTLLPQRVNMRQFWDSVPHPRDPKELGGWCWGAEVMTAWNYYFTQYEDYKGLMDEMRFWDRAKTPDELTKDWQKAVRGDEPGLVGWIPFDEGKGTTAADRIDKSGKITLHGALPWSNENAPLG